MKGLERINASVEVMLTCPEQERALNEILAQGIEIQNVQHIDELVCIFRVGRKDHPALRSLCDSRGYTLEVRKRTGLYWTVRRAANRKLLVSGLLMMLLLAWYLPTRVLFVRVEGNEGVPANKILDAAESCGIRFGASRKAVRSEAVKNELLSAVPQLQWAGVNTAGCVATVSVRERVQTDAQEQFTAADHIVAARDGYILSGTVTSGNALFQPGRSVKAGEVLISGYTDCGQYIRKTPAQGEVIAQTKHTLTVTAPDQKLKKGEIAGSRRQIDLIFRKKRINLWKDSGISNTSCGRMYEEYYLTVPGGFRLPVAICVDTQLYGELNQTAVEPETAEPLLQRAAREYLSRTMVAGSVLEAQEIFLSDAGTLCLQGEYICTEVISRGQREKIGETNGESG